MKKHLPFVLAALLITGVLAGCSEQGNTPPLTDSSAPIHTQIPISTDDAFTNDEYEKLFRLNSLAAQYSTDVL